MGKLNQICSTVQKSRKVRPDGTSEPSFEVRGVDDETSQLVLTRRGTSNDNASGFGAGWHAHLENLLQVLLGADTSSAILDVRYEELRPSHVALMDSIQNAFGERTQ